MYVKKVSMGNCWRDLMEYKGASTYNDDEFLKNYITRRNREESQNNIIEKSILFEFTDNVDGKRC